MSKINETSFVKKTKTIETGKTKELFDDSFEIERSLSLSDEKNVKAGKKRTQKPGKKIRTKEENTKDLKDKAKRIPEIVNLDDSVLTEKKRSSVKTGAQKKLSRSQLKALQKQRLEERKNAALAKIEEMQDNLVAADENLFDEDTQESIKRRHFADLSDSDKKKLVERSLIRQDNARLIEEYEEKAAKEAPDFSEVNEKELKKKISEFNKLPSEPFDLDKDDKFAANLEKNYSLCRSAENMQRWIYDAVEKGFDLEGVDLDAIQTKIASLMELKDYLDTQKALMKSPYYQYLTKKDVSYTDWQIDNILKKSTDEQLKDYLSNLKKLRGLSFIRKKGMSSTQEKAQKKGKREAEILRTRSEKRDAIAKFEENSLNFRADTRFTDKYLDDKYSNDAFSTMLADFNELRVSSIHFKSVTDIADNFQYNARLFERARAFGHMLFLAVNNGDAPSDDVLIKLRAKLRVFSMAEQFMYSLADKMQEHRENSLYTNTYDDIYENVIASLDRTGISEGFSYFKPGQDLDKIYDTAVRAYKKEHRDRKENIKKMYMVSHPYKEVMPDPEDKNNTIEVLKFKEISPEELELRAADFQKNAVKNDYMADVYMFAEHTNKCMNQSFIRNYEKRLGIKKIDGFHRVLPHYITGLSSDQLKNVCDMLVKGSAEEKKTFFKDLLIKLNHTDYNEMDMSDPDQINRNFAYKYRQAAMLANSNEKAVTDYLDNDDKILSKVANNIGCGHGQIFLGMTQAAISNMSRYGFAKDYLDKEAAECKEAGRVLITEASANGSVTINGNVTIDYDTYKKMDRFVGRVGFINDSNFSLRNVANVGKKYKNRVITTMYEELSAEGMWKDISKDEQKALSDHYNNIFKDYRELNLELLRKNVKGKNAIKEHCRRMEEDFKQILSFDISKFDIRSYNDIIKDPEKFKECFKIAKIARKGGVVCENYRQYINDGVKDLTYNDTFLKEIEARCDLINKAGVFYSKEFGSLFGSEIFNKKKDLTFDKLLHMCEGDLNELFEEFSYNKAITEDLKKVKKIIEDLGGFDLFTSLSSFEDEMRHKRGLKGESGVKDILNKLDGKTSAITGSKEGDIKVKITANSEFLSMFAPSFKTKSFTLNDREEKMDNVKSRLYKKRIISEQINDESISSNQRRFKAIRNLDVGTRILIGEKKLKDLSVFFTGDKKKDTELVKKFVDKDQKKEVLDKIVKDIFSMDIKVDMTGDEEFAKNVGMLEEIKNKAYALKAILKENPEYLETLKTLSFSDDTDDQRMIEKKLSVMFSISDLYRAKKLLYTNVYYIAHYNDELSANALNSDDEQRRVAELINLVNHTTKRLMGKEYNLRADDEIDAQLDHYESIALHDSYLSGRPDIEKMDPAASKKAHKEIKEYIKALNPGNQYSPDIKPLIGANDKKTFDGAKKHKTKAAENYIGLVQREILNKPDTNDNDILKIAYSERQIRVLRKLKRVLKDVYGKQIIDASLEGVVEGEKWGCFTDLERQVLDLAGMDGNYFPEDELEDIVEGLIFSKKYDLDMKDEKVKEYVKERWLNSAKRIYEIWQMNMKKFENTYGTLLDEVPMGCFYQSLGKGMKHFAYRNRFGQSVANLCDDKTCSINGREMTFTEFLVEKGMISKADHKDMFDKNCNYYQVTNLPMTSYFMNPFDPVSMNDEFPTTDPNFGFVENVLNDSDSLKRNVRFNGPKISYSQKRKLWKDAIETGDPAVYGGEENLRHNRKKYDLLSDSEKKLIKKTRREDVRSVTYYEFCIEDEKDIILKKTMSELKGVDKGFIERFIYLHPAFLQDNPKPEKVQQFYDILKKLCSDDIDVFRSGMDDFIACMSSYSGSNEYDSVFGANDNEVRMNRDVHIKNSVLNRKLLKQKIVDAMQSFVFTPDKVEKLDKRQYLMMKTATVDCLGFAILMSLNKSDHRLNAKDIGCKFQKKEELEYNELISDIKEYDLFLNRYDYNTEMLSPHNRALFEKYGIPYKEIPDYIDREAIKKAEEEKKKAEEEARKKAEELKKLEEEKKRIEEENKRIEEEKKRIEEENKRLEEEKEVKRLEERLKRVEEERKRNEEEQKRLEEEKKRFEELNKINTAPKKKVLTPEEARAIYTKEAKETREAILNEKGIPVPVDRDDLVKMRAPHYQKQFIDEDGHTDITWNDGEDPILIEHYDWLMQYYRYNDAGLDQNRDKNAPITVLDLNFKNRFSAKGADKIGEHQDTNNCYCCSGTNLLNVFISNIKKEKEPVSRYNQYDMRAYRPKVRVYKKEDEKLIEHETYKQYVMEVDKHQGAGKKATGSLFHTADFIFENLEKEGITNAAVGKMNFRLPSNPTTEQQLATENNMTAAFINKISEVLATGNPVSLLEVKGTYAHYLTITGITGGSIKYIDSDSREYCNKNKVVRISEFLKSGYTYELTWLRQVNDPNELKKEYSNLDYNEKDGYFTKKKDSETAMYTAQTKGICVRKEFEDRGPGLEDVSEAIYIQDPTKKFETQSIEEFYPSYNTYLTENNYRDELWETRQKNEYLRNNG